MATDKVATDTPAFDPTTDSVPMRRPLCVPSARIACITHGGRRIKRGGDEGGSGKQAERPLTAPVENVEGELDVADVRVGEGLDHLVWGVC